MNGNIQKKYVWCLKDIAGNVIASKKQLKPYDVQARKDLVIEKYRLGFITHTEALTALYELEN